MSTTRATVYLRITASILLAGLLAGCASDGYNGGPMAKPLPLGQSCGKIRSELRSLDNRGVPSKVEALNSGRRLSDRDRGLAQRYNQLLDSYLAARCHV